jgi:acyl-coenzyme A synthetase/AMP-(fatty) acid ligase
MAHYTEPLTGFLLLSSFAFDSSVAAVLWTLCAGGKLVIPDNDSHRDPARLAQLMRMHPVSHLLTIPSFYSLLLEQPDWQQIDSRHVAIVAGEACPVEVVERHRQLLPDVPLFNEYGIAQATVRSLVYDGRLKQQGSSMSIGRPVSNTEIYLLDSQLQPVPLGVRGELCIGEVCPVQGYLRRPGLTAEKFLPNPFSTYPGARLYKTGDITRYLPNRDIEFLGRVDELVKMRGYRVEPLEIEAVLREHESIRECVVMLNRRAGEENRLVGYIVCHDQREIGPGELRNYLKARLPEHMIPASFIMLDELPLTENGKIDRRALLAAKHSGLTSEEVYVPPRNEAEQIITGIWQEILMVDRIGVNDNFFDLGGHSLLIVKMHNRLHEVFETKISVIELFQHPTIRGIAKHIGQGQDQDAAVLKGEDRASMRKKLARRPKQFKQAN